MREVSCKVAEPFLQAADQRKIPREALLVGLDFDLAHLEDQHERIDHEAFLRFMANVKTHFTDAQIVEIGAAGVQARGVRSMIAIGRVVMTAQGFYRWMLSSGGIGNQIVSNIVPTFQEPEPGHYLVEVRWTPGYQPCPEWLLMSQGGLQAVSEALGFGRRATVELEMTPNGGRFDIRVPVRRTLRGWVFRKLGKRADATLAATQLEDATTALERRYAELDAARNRIEGQRALLDAAYRLGQKIWSERDVEKIATVVVDSLRELPGIAGARLDLGAEADVGRGALDAPALGAVELPGLGQRAHLAVWGTSERGDTQQLLELLAPTVALAISNARSYLELEQYQRGLEKLVEERTLELRQARDALASTVDQLREAQTARETFFANVNHEIRTPLSLIVLSVGEIEQQAGGALDPRTKRSLGTIAESSRKLLRLVDELLLLAAGDDVGMKVHPVAVDVAASIGLIADVWRGAAEAAGLELTVVIPDQLEALVDPVALERIVTNLLSNAIKYTPKGGKVWLTAEQQGDDVSIAVRDNGVGIDDELLKRLFSRFARGKGTADKRGTGIGLSLVKQLVEAHGGAIELARVPTGGSEFRVRWPVGDVAAGRSAQAPVASRFAPRLRPVDYDVSTSSLRSGQVLDPPGTSRGTILVAEDDPRLAQRVASLLADEYKVVIALDGAAALEQVGPHQPHMLITDVDMPNLTGIELAAKFRQMSGDRVAPVLILSAVRDLGTRVAGLDAGAVDYMLKPFDPSELKARVRAQFRMRELAISLQRAEQLAALSTLSAGLAHELRNPANAVVNAVRPLKMLLPKDMQVPTAPAAQLLDVLQGCAEQIGVLSRHLLDFHGEGVLEQRTVPITDVVARAMAVVTKALDGVELRRQLAPGMNLRCSPALLAAVLSNLVENGAHAAGPGGWVEITATHSGGRAVIEVGDSGPGVPRDLRERVFDAFYTTKPPGVGVGLGLAMARDIVHRHGGTLEIRDRGERSVFVVELPGLVETGSA